MAFGFPPKYEQSIDIQALTPQYYLAIAIEAARQLKWDVTTINKNGFAANIGGSFLKSREEFRLTIEDTKAVVRSTNASGGLVDLGKNKKHVDAFLDRFENVKMSLNGDALIEKLEELKPVFEQQEEEGQTPPAAEKTGLKDLKTLFIPREGYFVTPIIIIINILVFAAMVISGANFFDPGTHDLLRWGADLRSATLDGQWWRLITNTFVHIGILHLLLNMYALMYVGLLMEPYFDKLTYAAAYLFTGLLASLLSIAYHVNVVSAGASGAIFGMFGVFLAMLTTNLVDKSIRKNLLMSIGIFVFINLAYGMQDGVDNSAHVGGLISGIIIGYIYYPFLRKPGSIVRKYVTLILVTLIVFGISASAYSSMPNVMLIYTNQINEFQKHEDEALTLYKMPKNATTDQYLSVIEKGQVDWDTNMKLLAGLDNLDLPDYFKNRVQKLKQYCLLRQKSYALMHNDFENDTNVHQKTIDSCYTQISAIIKDLKK